jgi:hypothetical protein
VDQARLGRFDSERKARCGPDSRPNMRDRLRLQGTERGGEVSGRYDRPGCAGDFGQPLRDIRRLSGCQRQIPGRSVPSNERQDLSDIGGDLARQAATPRPEVSQTYTEGIDNVMGAFHGHEGSRAYAWNAPGRSSM